VRFSLPKQMIPPIEGGRIRLRLIERTDLPMTLRWRNQDHIRKGFFHSEIISPEQHQVWFEGYLERDNDYVFIIEETYKFQRPVGQISLYNIDWNKKRTELGRFMIGDAEASGKGLAKKACQLLIEFAFDQWNLGEIYLRVLKQNAVIAFYRKLNFQREREYGNKVFMRLLNPIFVQGQS